MVRSPARAGAGSRVGSADQLGALDREGRITPLGRAMADLPLHPRLARLVRKRSGGFRPAQPSPFGCGRGNRRSFLILISEASFAPTFSGI